MITIYLDHNVIDKFDNGKTAYLEPIFANKEYQAIISIASIDEIFRGGNQDRSKRNIESLKKLGVKYIHSGNDELHMSIDELDYVNIHAKWLEMQSVIAPLNSSLFLFFSALYGRNAEEAYQNMECAETDKVNWIKKYSGKFPKLQNQVQRILCNSEERKQLVALKGMLPFTTKEINNISEESIFWTCVDKLKNADDDNLSLIGHHIQNEIENEATIEDQLMFVLNWLNLFGYYPDKLAQINKTRSNFSDALHGTYAIACDGLLTLDKNFAKRIAAAMRALTLKTTIGTDANELLFRITQGRI